MKDLIVHAFEQAHDNFTRMLAEFLPRFLVMLIIIAIGFLVATVVVTAGIFGYIMTRNLRRK